MPITTSLPPDLGFDAAFIEKADACNPELRDTLFALMSKHDRGPFATMLSAEAAAAVRAALDRGNLTPQQALILMEQFNNIVGTAEGNINDVKLDDPEQSPDLQALQIKYQDAIGRVMLAQLAHREPLGFLAIINALAHHIVIAIRALDEAGSLTPGAKERILKRLELSLRQASGP